MKVRLFSKRGKVVAKSSLSNYFGLAQRSIRQYSDYTPPDDTIYIIGNGIAALHQMAALATLKYSGKIVVVSEIQSHWFSMNNEVRLGQTLRENIIPFGMDMALPQPQELKGTKEDYPTVEEYKERYLIPLQQYIDSHLNVSRIYQNVQKLTPHSESGIIAHFSGNHDLIEGGSTPYSKHMYHVIVATGGGRPRQINPQIIHGKPNTSLDYPQIVDGPHMLAQDTAHNSAEIVAVEGSGGTATWVVEQSLLAGKKVIWISNPKHNRVELMGGHRNRSPQVLAAFNDRTVADILAIELDENSNEIKLRLSNGTEQIVHQVITARGSNPDAKFGATNLLSSFKDRMSPIINPLGPLEDMVVGITADAGKNSVLDVIGGAGYACYRKLQQQGKVDSPYVLLDKVPPVSNVGSGISMGSAAIGSKEGVSRYSMWDMNINHATPEELRMYLLAHTGDRLPLGFINNLAQEIIKERSTIHTKKSPEDPSLGHGLSAEQIETCIKEFTKKKHQSPLPKTKIQALAKGKPEPKRATKFTQGQIKELVDRNYVSERDLEKIAEEKTQIGKRFT